MSFLQRTIKLLIRRLPHMALWAVSLIVIVEGGLFLYYRFAPPSLFLKYTSINAQSIEEGQDLPVTLCRNKRRNYNLIGTRTFYKVASQDRAEDHQRVGTIHVDTVLEDATCADIFIYDEEFHHTAGYYYFVSDLCFKVQGQEKCLSHKSNVYTVFPDRPDTPEQIQIKIKELEQEIERLRELLARAMLTRGGQQPQAVATGNTGVTTTRSRGSTPSGSTSGPSNNPQSPGNPDDPDEPDNPTLIEAALAPVNALLDGVDGIADNLQGGLR